MIEENRDHVPAAAESSKEGENNDSKFTEGEILEFVRVRFPGHAKSYPFLVGKRKLLYGQKVMAMSDRGIALGYINSFVYKAPFKKTMLPLKFINKLASDEDVEQERDVYKKQKHAENVCHDLIEKYNLDMNLTHVEFTGMGKKVVFYFIAPARVDFRNLVKDLVTELKLRIELRQISLRDRSASMGAIGPCGRELCCSSFLAKYGNVSIKMAKNQNLTLNYSRLNGVCGQLKCCLQYEDQVYAEKRSYLPKEGSMVETKNGDQGKVTKLDILKEQFDMMTSEGKIKRYVAEAFENYLPPSFKMPRKFDHISDETGTIIGQDELVATKVKINTNQELQSQNDAIEYAHEEFTKHTDVETLKKEGLAEVDSQYLAVKKTKLPRPQKPARS